MHLDLNENMLVVPGASSLDEDGGSLMKMVPEEIGVGA